MAATMEASIRVAYKKLVKLANSLPVDQKTSTLKNIREEFRSHKGITTTEELDQLLVKAQSKISYLKIVTPKRTPQTSPLRYIYKDGKRIDSREIENGIGQGTIKTTDVDFMMKKHVQLIRRQHFMDRK